MATAFIIGGFFIILVILGIIDDHITKEQISIDEFQDRHPVINTIFGIFILLFIIIAPFVGVLKIASWFLSPSNPEPTYSTEYTQKEQPTTTKEVVEIVNDAIKDKNLNTAESRALLEKNKTKLTVRAEVENGSNIKEAKLEFVLDSVTDKDIDFAHNAIAGIVTQIKE